MVNSPPEWKTDASKALTHKSVMANNINDTERGLTRRKLNSPIITIPELQPLKTSKLSKDFKGNVDEEFKTRSSQLSDAHFKEMPCLIKVTKTQLTGHFIPGFTTSENDLVSRPRHFEQIRKKNEFGFDRTANKGITVRKINPEDVTNKVSQKNKFNDVSFEGNRHRIMTTPIVPVQQERKKILIKK